MCFADVSTATVHATSFLCDEGFAIKITDVATGKVLKDCVASCFIGVVAGIDVGEKLRGDSLSFIKANPTVIINAIERLQELIDVTKKEFMTAIIGDCSFDRFLDFLKRKGGAGNG